MESEMKILLACLFAVIAWAILTQVAGVPVTVVLVVSAVSAVIGGKIA